MNIRTRSDQIEAAEKTINKKKIEDIRKYDMSKIEEAVRNEVGLKNTKRRLGVG